MNIKKERILLIVGILCLIANQIAFYINGLEILKMWSGVQILSILLGIIFEALHVSWSKEEAKYRFCNTYPTWAFIIMIFFFTLLQIEDYLMENEDSIVLSDLTFWFVLWSIFIAWLVGKTLVRQVLLVNRSKTRTDSS